MPDEPRTQFDKFKKATRQLKTDDGPERSKKRLGELVRHKPAPEKPE